MKYYFLALATLVTVCVGCEWGPNGRMAGGQATSMLGGPDQGVIARGNLGGGYAGHGNYFAPPANLMLHPGPGVEGPGPGVLNPIGLASANSFSGRSTQIKFVEPEGMPIGWQIPRGYPGNQNTPPGPHSLPQGANSPL